MNMEIEKKEYVAPAMTVVEMRSEDAPILCMSDSSDNGYSGDDGDLYID